MPRNANYTQVPNILFDLMPHISGAQFAVLMVVARQTYGWQKSEDTISLSQFVDKTGLSLSGIRQAVGELLLQGFLLRRGVGKQNHSYMIDLDPVERFMDELCHSATQLDEKLCHSVTQLPDELCHSVTPQKKEPKEKELKKDVSSFSSTTTTPDEDIKQILQQWQNATAIMPTTRDKSDLRRLCAQYGTGTVAEAITIAQGAGKTSLGYVRGILSNKAPVASPTPTLLTYQRWLEQNYNCGVAYMIEGVSESELEQRYAEYKQQAASSPAARQELGFSLSSI